MKLFSIQNPPWKLIEVPQMNQAHSSLHDHPQHSQDNGNVPTILEDLLLCGCPPVV